MKKINHDFSKRELALIFIIILLIGLVGWYASRLENKPAVSSINSFEECAAAGNPIMESYPERCAADGQTFTRQYTDYTDSTSTFSIRYPASMTMNLAEDCCEGEPKDWSEQSRPFTLVPPSNGQIDGMSNNEGLSVQAGGGVGQEIQNNWLDNNHEPEQREINGYDAQYVKIDFNGDAEQYVDHNYLISNGEDSVFFSYRESYKSSTISTEFDASEFVPLYDSVINSIKFL